MDARKKSRCIMFKCVCVRAPKCAYGSVSGWMCLACSLPFIISVMLLCYSTDWSIDRTSFQAQYNAHIRAHAHDPLNEAQKLTYALGVSVEKNCHLKTYWTRCLLQLRSQEAF